MHCWLVLRYMYKSSTLYILKEKLFYFLPIRAKYLSLSIKYNRAIEDALFSAETFIRGFQFN